MGKLLGAAISYRRWVYCAVLTLGAQVVFGPGIDARELLELVCLSGFVGLLVLVTTAGRLFDHVRRVLGTEGVDYPQVRMLGRHGLAWTGAMAGMLLLKLFARGEPFGGINEVTLESSLTRFRLLGVAASLVWLPMAIWEPPREAASGSVSGGESGRWTREASLEVLMVLGCLAGLVSGLWAFDPREVVFHR